MYACNECGDRLTLEQMDITPEGEILCKDCFDQPFMCPIDPQEALNCEACQ